MRELGADKTRPSLDHARAVSEAETKRRVPPAYRWLLPDTVLSLGYLERPTWKAGHLEPGPSVCNGQRSSSLCSPWEC